jgi:hypothetical protein
MAAERKCLHCVIGEALNAQLGADVTKWSQDDIQRVTHEIVEGLAEIVACFVRRHDRKRLMSSIETDLREQVTRMVNERMTSDTDYAAATAAYSQGVKH